LPDDDKVKKHPSVYQPRRVSSINGPAVNNQWVYGHFRKVQKVWWSLSRNKAVLGFSHS